MKKILAISLSLSMVLALASCGGNEDTSSVASTASTATSSAVVSTATSSEAVSSATESPVVISSAVSSEAESEGPAATNVATGGETFYDGGEDDTLYTGDTGECVAANIVDGDVTTAWQLNSTLGENETHDYGDDPVYVGVTWEDAATITEVSVLFENGSRPAADGYTVEYTTDGEDWEEIEDAEYTAASVDGTADIVTFEAIEDVTGVRVMIYKTSSKWSAKVFEVEVTGTVAEADAETDAE